MNIQDLALLFDGVSKGLATGMKEKEKKELVALVGMFRRFPNQSITDFIRFVEGAFSKERNSVPALVERIKAIKEGEGEPEAELQASLATIKVPDLKKVVVALGMRPSTKKDDNIKLIHGHLTGRAGSHVSASELPEQVGQAYARYEAIKADLRSITVEEMRSRVAVIGELPKPVLAGVLSKLGYSADGSKEEMAAQLLDNLTSIKMSLDQTKKIGS